MSDFPPLYTAVSLPDRPSLPQYTQSAGEHERVLTSEPSSPVVFAVSPMQHCMYGTDHLEIDLGHFPATLSHPAYGYNGLVAGTVKFKKGCTHVKEVIVKLEGIVTTTAAEHSHVAVASISKITLFSRTSTLVDAAQCAQGSSDGARCICADTEYAFELAFPSFVDGRETALPPTYTAVQPGICVEVAYYLQVDIVRKGIFRRHEVRKIPVLYLPRTAPPLASLMAFRVSTPDDLPERVKAVEILPVWPKTCQSRALSENVTLPSIHLFHPLPKSYASGEYIPLGLRIACPTSPALCELYASTLTVQLIRRRKVLFGPTQQIAVMEKVLNTAKPGQRVDLDPGSCYLSLRLEAGLTGRETTWRVDGAIEIAYFIRVVIRPVQRDLPTFQLEEPVLLTTDSFEGREAEGYLSEPAIGLTTLTAPRRALQVPSRGDGSA